MIIITDPEVNVKKYRKKNKNKKSWNEFPSRLPLIIVYYLYFASVLYTLALVILSYSIYLTENIRKA